MIDDLVTVCIPTSPIPSHPSTSILYETVRSVRYHLYDAPILFLADGVREEQKEKLYDYEKYVARLEDYCSHPDENATMVSFEEHTHQVGMLRRAFLEIDTPYILFVEHDCPLVNRPIEWDAIHTELSTGTVSLVRFLHETNILECHEYLMGGTIDTKRLKLRETTQFSARPHIATKAFYEKLLGRFSPEAKCFVEDGAHSICQSEPWSEWKMSIYLDPEGKDSKFSYHLDGRAQAKKYDETQVF